MKQKWKDGLAVGSISAIIYCVLALLLAPVFNWGYSQIAVFALGLFCGHAFLIPLIKK